MQVFQQWIEQRNKRVKEQFPRDLFDKPYSVEMISSCLQRFVAEAKRADGTPYPPHTLFWLLSMKVSHLYCMPKHVNGFNKSNFPDVLNKLG